MWIPTISLSAFTKATTVVPAQESDCPILKYWSNNTEATLEPTTTKFRKPGATFWFELPLNTEPGNITLHPQEYLNTLLAPTQETESIPKQQEENKTAPNHTLLVVDDNKDLTDYLATALKDRFKTIWVAADGEEALRLCRKKRPHIVVSDIQMPRMNGYELCKQIKEDLEISHIPVILLTARNDEESQLYGYKNGADAYVTKPLK